MFRFADAYAQTTMAVIIPPLLLAQAIFLSLRGLLPLLRAVLKVKV